MLGLKALRHKMLQSGSFVCAFDFLSTKFKGENNQKMLPWGRDPLKSWKLLDVRLVPKDESSHSENIFLSPVVKPSHGNYVVMIIFKYMYSCLIGSIVFTLVKTIDGIKTINFLTTSAGKYQSISISPKGSQCPSVFAAGTGWQCILAIKCLKYAIYINTRESRCQSPHNVWCEHMAWFCGQDPELCSWT